MLPKYFLQKKGKNDSKKFNNWLKVLFDLNTAVISSICILNHYVLFVLRSYTRGGSTVQ